MSDNLGQLTRVNADSSMNIYSQISALASFIDTMGAIFFQTGAGGVQSAADGKLLAFTCVSENKPWTEIARVNHLIKGRLTKKADVMLGEFCLAGGVHEWVSQGQDGKAILRLTHNGKTIESAYSLDDAKRAGIDLAKGNWAARPASMLRARATSEGVRMIAPWIVSGIYTPEEISDFTEGDNAPAPAPAENASAPKTRGKKEKTSGTAGDVIDAEFTVTSPAPVTAPASASKTEEPPFETKQTTPDVTATTTTEAPVSDAGTTSETSNNDVTMLLIEIGLKAVQAGYGATSEQAYAALEGQLQKGNPGLKLEAQDKPKLEKLLTVLNAKAEASKGK